MMSLNKSASPHFILAATLCLLSACASTTKRDFASENYVKNHLEDSESYNSYPFELLVGRISTSQFGSVDVENNIAAKLDLTEFGEVLRGDLADSISRAGNFEAVSKATGGLYLEGNVLELIASNSFSCGGLLVEAAAAVSMLPHRGDEALWGGEYRLNTCFRYNDYDFSQLEFTERYIKAFSLLSKALSQLIADDIGQSPELMKATENVLGVNVYSIEERAEDHRREVAESQKQQQLDKELAAEQKRVEEQRAAEQKRAEAQRAAEQKRTEAQRAAEKTAKENSAAAIKAQEASESGLLNVIGIHPGISTKDQFNSKKESYGYLIGGYELTCKGEFVANALYRMTCLTGEEFLSRDRVSGDKNRLVDNAEVHKVLREGFQKKFGSPKVLTNQVRNGFGAKFQQEILSWTDAAGNRLTLFSFVSDLNTGTLLLESFNAVEDREREEREADAQREF
jgi:hypothetical protein